MMSNGYDISVFVIGILGSVLILLSYLFSNQKKLRIINLIASTIFVIYGFGLVITSALDWHYWPAWPTVVLNAFCAIVHIRWLIINHKKDSVNGSQTDKTDDESNNSGKPKK